MVKIIWNDEFSVGNKKLDEQHLNIINFINELIDQPEVTVHSETLHDILYKMMLYSKEHLAYEEQLLKANDYPDFINHKAGHSSYIKKFVQLSNSATVQDSTVPFEVLNYLRNWWENHILKEDMIYRSFLSEKGLS